VFAEWLAENFPRSFQEAKKMNEKLAREIALNASNKFVQLTRCVRETDKVPKDSFKQYSLLYFPEAFQMLDCF